MVPADTSQPSASSDKSSKTLKLLGKPVAEAIQSDVTDKIQQFAKKYSRSPKLAVILVGEDGASAVYVRSKGKACEKVGIKSETIRLPSTVSEAELINKVSQLNADAEVDGILIQLPLPKQINAEKVLNLVDPMKDVDAFTTASSGEIFKDQSLVYPCTPSGVMRMLAFYKIAVAGKNVVVIGRSQIVGKPMAMLMLKENATVTVCHSKTEKLENFTRAADIVVVAVGKREFLGRSAFSEKSVVIDVGIHGSGTGGQICGDVKFSELDGYVAAISPVPGGVGPLTIAVLLENTLKLAEARCQQL
jgi:methylenetetrahydrofolate dehydrogenase (NADP+)/methenyltetrahydrofolate cyclohydrolase